jgi:hypothetical protein
MKQVTVTLTFVISDSRWNDEKDVQGVSVEYLEARGTRVGKYVECQQLYNVQVPEDSPYTKAGGGITEDRFLACFGQKNNYTRGQAIKKARVFEGKVVKCDD